MNITELKTMIDGLSLAEQEELLRHLEESLRRRRTGGMQESREDWMRRLESLRTSLGSGATAGTSEQILADLRDE